MKAMVGGVDVLKLMRLRNPWSERMWTGAWSDEYVTLADPLIITGNTVRVTPPSHRIITFLILPIWSLHSLFYPSDHYVLYFTLLIITFFILLFWSSHFLFYPSIPDHTLTHYIQYIMPVHTRSYKIYIPLYMPDRSYKIYIPTLCQSTHWLYQIKNNKK